MSKQSEAKARQRYVEKPIQSVCSNCEHFRSNKEPFDGVFGEWTRESNLRCTLGGFAVKKTATCDCWRVKGTKEEATEKKWDTLL